MFHFIFIDHTLEGLWPGKEILSVFCKTVSEADKVFENKFGKHPSKLPHIGCQVHKIIIGNVLAASGLFNSKSDIIRSIKGKSVKINRVTVESFNDELELGDFLNFIWLPNATELLAEHGPNLLTIHKGKSAVLVQLKSTGLTIIAG